jgi:hypothetical protein
MQGHEVVWDGRFAVTAHAAGLVVRPGRKGRPQIEPVDGARDGMPPDATIVPLVGPRFLAAAGLIDREPG